MPRFAVKVNAIVEVEATDEHHAQDKARDIFVTEGVVRYLIAKCQPVLWEGE